MTLTHKSKLTESDLSLILYTPKSIFTFKDDLNEDDLAYLFGHVYDTTEMDADKRTTELLLAFVRSDVLCGQSITQKVQEKIAEHTNKDNAIDLFKIFIDYRIKISDAIMKKFIQFCPTDVIKSGWPISRDVLSHGILKHVSVENLAVLVDYAKDNCVKLSVEEQFVIIEKYLPYIEKHKDNITGVKSGRFYDSNFPPSKALLEKIVDKRSVLEFFAKQHIRIFDKANPELRIKAIKTLPTKELFDIMQEYNVIYANEEIQFYVSGRNNGQQETVKFMREHILKHRPNKASLYIETLDQVEVEKTSLEQFKTLDQDILLALLRTNMDKIAWYKMVENMLRCGSNLPNEVLKEMIEIDRFTERMVKKYKPEYFAPKIQQQQTVKKPCSLLELFGKNRERGDD